MTQEEKAKRYDEALERAKGVIEQNPLMEYLKKGIEYILPELKESEDAMIIRELTSLFKDGIKGINHTYTGEDCERWVAWLEKQSTPQVRTGLEWVNTIDDACDKRYSEEYAHGEYCHEQSFKWGFQEGVDWLEKQGEQKPTDKVEPKFKVGDWVVRGKTIAQILDIQEQYYIGLDIDGTDFTSSKFLSDDKIHLWTIQDAKDGDVLANNGNIILFKEISNSARKDYKYIKSHCLVLMHSLNFYTGGSYNLDDGFHPATKEQRDTLMKAMANAGYTFDFEKRELKKIEQKPAWSEEDEQYLLVCKNALAKYQTTDKWDATIISQWLENKLKFLKDRVQPQLKQEWSKEDEKIVEHLINLHKVNLKVNHYPDLEVNKKVNELKMFFKSLRPQNWTKEDKERYISCLQRLSTGNPEQPETINSKWFKEHVYPQPTWKPSEEHYELEEFAKIVRGNLTGISKAVQKLFEAKYLQLTGNKMYGGFED